MCRWGFFESAFRGKYKWKPKNAKHCYVSFLHLNRVFRKLISPESAFPHYMLFHTCCAMKYYLCMLVCDKKHFSKAFADSFGPSRFVNRSSRKCSISLEETTINVHQYHFCSRRIASCSFWKFFMRSLVPKDFRFLVFSMSISWENDFKTIS